MCASVISSVRVTGIPLKQFIIFLCLPKYEVLLLAHALLNSVLGRRLVYSIPHTLNFSSTTQA